VVGRGRSGELLFPFLPLNSLLSERLA
jgi:hypothetical protein